MLSKKKASTPHNKIVKLSKQKDREIVLHTEVTPISPKQKFYSKQDLKGVHKRVSSPIDYKSCYVMEEAGAIKEKIQK